MEAAGAREFADQVLSFELHALILVADGEGRAGRVQLLGDAPGDRTLVREPEHHSRLACQINHAYPVPPMPVLSPGSCLGNRFLEYQSLEGHHRLREKADL